MASKANTNNIDLTNISVDPTLITTAIGTSDSTFTVGDYTYTTPNEYTYTTVTTPSITMGPHTSVLNPDLFDDGTRRGMVESKDCNPALAEMIDKL